MKISSVFFLKPFSSTFSDAKSKNKWQKQRKCWLKGLRTVSAGKPMMIINDDIIEEGDDKIQEALILKF